MYWMDPNFRVRSAEVMIESEDCYYLPISMPKNSHLSIIIHYLSLSLIYRLQIYISFAILYTMQLLLSTCEGIWPYGQQQVARFIPGKDPTYSLKQSLPY